MGRAMEHLEALMDRTDKVPHRFPGTDLTFSIKDIPCSGMHGNRNIPDGEVYTSPVKNSVNGYISYNCPSPYDGFLFGTCVSNSRTARLSRPPATIRNT